MEKFAFTDEYKKKAQSFFYQFIRLIALGLKFTGLIGKHKI